MTQTSENHGKAKPAPTPAALAARVRASRATRDKLKTHDAALDLQSAQRLHAKAVRESLKLIERA